MLRSLLCKLGLHSGRCIDGAFRCSHCPYMDAYRWSPTWIGIDYGKGDKCGWCEHPDYDCHYHCHEHARADETIITGSETDD